MAISKEDRKLATKLLERSIRDIEMEVDARIDLELEKKVRAKEKSLNFDMIQKKSDEWNDKRNAAKQKIWHYGHDEGQKLRKKSRKLKKMVSKNKTQWLIDLNFGQTPIDLKKILDKIKKAAGV